MGGKRRKKMIGERIKRVMEEEMVEEDEGERGGKWSGEGVG